MPSCAEAWLVRGAYKIKWAWEARGGDFSNSTSGFTFDVFFERLEEAEDDLNRAIDLVPANAEPYCYLLTSGMGLQISEEEMFARFTELKVRSPYHFGGHVAKLYSMTQRWGGSHEEMFQFAYDALKEVPEGSGLHALVADAHIERWFEYVLDEGKAAGSLYIKSSNVRNDLKRAYEKSLGSPKYIPGGEDAIYRSYFAAAFYLSGQHTLASNEMDKLSKQIPEYPWALLSSRPWDITDAGYVVDRIQKQCSHRNIKR